MPITTPVHVRCPSCSAEHDVEVVQSINARTDAEQKQRLLAGELNVLACACGKRTILAATVLYHDPDADYYCRVCTDGDVAAAAEAFVEAGVTGTKRIVPSLNALVEKVKILDAKLDDAAIEVLKVLLLGSLGEGDLNRVLLFDSVRGDVIRWLMLSPAPELLTSALAQYETLSDVRAAADEVQIDRAWAVEAAQRLVTQSARH